MPELDSEDLENILFNKIIPPITTEDLSPNKKLLSPELTNRIESILYMVEQTKNAPIDDPIHLDNITLIFNLLFKMDDVYYSEAQLSLRKALVDLFKKIEYGEGIKDVCLKTIEYLGNNNVGDYLTKIIYYINEYAHELVRTAVIKEKITDKDKLTSLYNQSYNDILTSIKTNLDFNHITNDEKLAKLIATQYIAELVKKDLIDYTLSQATYPAPPAEDLQNLITTEQVDHKLYPGFLLGDKLNNQKIGIMDLPSTPSILLHDEKSFIIDSYKYGQNSDMLISKIRQIFEGSTKLATYIIGGTIDLIKRDELISNIQTIFKNLAIESDIIILPLEESTSHLILNTAKLKGEDAT